MALDGLGLDPISFNYRPMELLRETYSDYKQFMKTMVREWTIFKATRGDFISSLKMRRDMLSAEGWGLRYVSYPVSPYHDPVSSYHFTVLGYTMP